MTYALIILLGTVLGAWINWAIYAWAWCPRAISPWSAPPTDAPPRRLTDRIPILGWLGLRREVDCHIRRQREILRRWEPAGKNVKIEEPRIFGIFFWLRPLLIELLFGPLLAFIYWWQVDQLRLIDPEILAVQGAAALAGLHDWMFLLFLFHGLLITLLMVATFIDFDEKTIPDAITIPGTLLALALATAQTQLSETHPLQLCLPWSMASGSIAPVLFFSPRAWDPVWSSNLGLLTAECIFALWCFGLANRRWIERHGLKRAVRYFFAGLVKYDMLLLGRFKMKNWLFLAGLWGLGSLAIAIVFQQLSPTAWAGLLSSLVGLGIGGGQIWAVRVVARLGLGKEAMGFGDVTLMAMVGAFLGWQAALFAFFLAPVTALLIVATSWLLTGNRMLPFGPYLATASILTVLFWDRVWNQWAATVFMMGPLIGAVLGFALVAMCAMLFLLRLAEDAIGKRRRD